MLPVLDETASVSEQVQFWVLEGNVHQVQRARVNLTYELLTVMIGVPVPEGKSGGVQCPHSLELDPWVFAKQFLIVNHPGVGQTLVCPFHQGSNRMGNLCIYIWS